MATIVSAKRGPPKALRPCMAEQAVRETLNLTESSKVSCRCFYDPGEAQTKYRIGTNRLVLHRLCDHFKFDVLFRLVLRASFIKLSDMEDGSEMEDCASGEKRSVACAAIAHSVCMDFLGRLA